MMNDINLIRLFWDCDKNSLSIELSVWLGVIALIIAAWLIYRYFRTNSFSFVEMNIKLGGLGAIKFKPNLEDVQIAHKIWTELVTRKAALKIDPEHDVIVEVYNSWHVLFGKVRDLISDIPAEKIRREKSTQKLIEIATGTLNLGLRPHLTQWQARFRSWYESQQEKLKTMTPQELQREFDQYDELILDMQRINVELIDYAKQLKKIINN